MEIINLIVPIFLVIMLGYALKKTGFLTEAFGHELSKFVFYIALPVMLFYKTSIIDFSKFISWEVVITYPVCALTVALLSFLYALKLDSFQRGAFVQGAFRPNLAYLGLPVVLTVLGDAALGFAAVIIALGTVVNTIMTIGLFKLMDTNRGDVHIVLRLVGVLKNPLIISITLGVLFSLMNLSLPTCLANTAKIISPISLALILITVGISLSFSEIREYLKYDFAAATFKLVLMPLLAYLIASKICGLSGVPLHTAILMMGMPTAIVSYTFAKELNSDSKLALSIVNFNTLAAMITIPIMILLMG